MQKNAGVTLAFFLMSEFLYFQGTQFGEKVKLYLKFREEY